jgi:hypothetical protein
MVGQRLGKVIHYLKASNPPLYPWRIGQLVFSPFLSLQNPTFAPVF